jgi:hypothetical protein
VQAACISVSRPPFGEGNTEARYYFAAAYAACAALAFAASQLRGSEVGARAGPFWLRIGILCLVFVALRAVNANVAVAGAIRDFAHSEHLTNWKRPGPYLMLAAMFALGAAILGLLLFVGRTLHPAVRGAAISIILILLLAVAQSASLYFAGTFLQTQIGPATLSRIIEALLLACLAGCAIWFIRDARNAAA